MKRLLLVLSLLSTPVFADFQTWAAFMFNTPLSSRFLAYFEIQNRMYRDSSTEQRLLVRPALGIKINDNHSAWIGYGWTPLFSPVFHDEHRFWQQSLAKYDWGRWKLQFRFRLEERLIAGDSQIAWRWREFIRGTFAVSPDWSLVVWDEFFFALNKTPSIATKGFDQNRLFIGAQIPLAPDLSLEPGYMNLVVRGASSSALSHVLAVYLFWNADFLNEKPPAPHEVPKT